MTRERLEQIEADARTLLDAMITAQCPSPDAADLRERIAALERGNAPAPAPDPNPDPDPDIESAPEAFERAPTERSARIAEIEADARVLLDTMLANRSHGEAPQLGSVPRLGRAPRLGRSPRLARVGAVAAALVLFGLATGALANNWLAAQRQAELERFAAHAYRDAARSFEALDPPPPVLTFDTARIPVQPPKMRPVPTALAVEPPSPAAAAPRPDRSALLAQLDAEAYAHLRAGERSEAAQTFEQITKLGGRSEYAELAFGELFALARQQPQLPLEKLWRRYLKRFPKGRYADAAQAGLCRQTRGAQRQRCWIDYLNAHPRGAARSEALRESE